MIEEKKIFAMNFFKKFFCIVLGLLLSKQQTNSLDCHSANNDENTDINIGESRFRLIINDVIHNENAIAPSKKFSQRAHALVIILVRLFYKKRKNFATHGFIAIIKKNRTQWFLQMASQKRQSGRQTPLPNFEKCQLNIPLINYLPRQIELALYTKTR